MSLGFLSAHADRKFRRAGAGIFIPPESLFHNSVLQRMKCDDADSSAVCKKVNHPVKGIAENVQFPVDLDGIAWKVLLAGVRRPPLLSQEWQPL